MTTRSTLRTALRALIAVPTAVVVTVAMAGCAGDESSGARPSASAASSSPDETTNQTGVTMPIVLEFDGQEIAGELDGSPTAASLLAQLPLTLTFGDFGGVEKFAELPEPLSLDGAPEGSAAPPLTIGYYVPDQRLILYYDAVGFFNGIVPIGSYEDSAALQNQSADFTVTIRAR
jgi:hypothetical protein